MSIKRRINYKVSRLIYNIQNLPLPGWVNSITLKVSALLVIAFFGTGYIMTTSSSAGVGYGVSHLEKQINNLSQEEKKIQMQIAEQSSLKNIESKITSLDMIPASKIKHYRADTGVVAQR